MYIEYLSFFNAIFLAYNIFFKKLKIKNKIVFYIDKTFFSIIVTKILNYLFEIKFQYLNFKLINIKDHNNELIRLRIFRKDLIELQNQIIHNHALFKEIRKNTKLNFFYDYLYKSLVAGHLVMNPESLVRAVFIIQVVLWHSNKINISNISFYVCNRYWFDELKTYAKNYNIKLYKIPQISKFYRKKNFFILNITQSNFPLIFQIYNIFKKFILLNNPFVKYNIGDSKIYSFHQGHYNLKNDGLNSDLFYFHNSNLEAEKIICEYSSNKILKELESKNFNIINKKIVFPKNLFVPIKNFNFKKNGLSSLEYNFITTKLKEYNLSQRRTHIFSKVNNIKIFLTWDKYQLYQIAQHETINQLGGIYAVWQYAFEGTPSCTSQISTDLYFSNFPEKFFYNNNSKIKYFINTGFLMDYKFELLKEKARIIRNKLMLNGANYIVAIFDENSNQYERWHTGHILQAENYEVILKELLNNPNLGVIFKPKNARTLRQRIGSVNELLVEAENTGRCFVHDDYTDNFTSAPPVLAGLSSDICIHSHLCAGTAGIECALANIPTILIDREGSPENILYNLSDQNLIFKNWNDAIYAINHHLNSKNKNNNFGKWPDHFLNSLDNFRDGKAAFRMGEYLNTMINYIKENKSKDEVMDIAAEIYIKKYGIDKITTIN